ncbi:MAG: hypothetical protein QXJ71_06985 [Pyrobaculum sp.]
MRKHAALTRYLTYAALILLVASLAVQLATSGAGMVLRLFRGETAAEITFIDLLGILLLELAPIVGLALLSLKSKNKCNNYYIFYIIEYIRNNII